LIIVQATDELGAVSPILQRNVYRVETNLRPNVSIDYPTGDRQVADTVNTYNFQGTSNDIDGSIAAVEFRIAEEIETTIETLFHVARRAGEWLPANNLTVDWSQWSFDVTDLEPGENIVEVRAT